MSTSRAVTNRKIRHLNGKIRRQRVAKALAPILIGLAAISVATGLCWLVTFTDIPLVVLSVIAVITMVVRLGNSIVKGLF